MLRSHRAHSALLHERHVVRDAVYRHDCALVRAELVVADAPQREVAARLRAADVAESRIAHNIVQHDAAVADGHVKVQQQSAALLVKLLVVVAIARAGPVVTCVLTALLTSGMA